VSEQHVGDTVLVVDDDEIIRESVVWSLREEGYTVLEAADGKAALDQMRAHEEGMVVLLDLAMPQVDGYTVVQAVELEPTLATRHAYIVMTAQDRTLHVGFVEQMTRLQITVLPKPFDLDKLLEAVASAAERLRLGPEESGTST
jgi:CheY-like chemotaxis protein